MGVALANIAWRVSITLWITLAGSAGPADERESERGQPDHVATETEADRCGLASRVNVGQQRAKVFSSGSASAFRLP
jgi:hypothetical protein